MSDTTDDSKNEWRISVEEDAQAEIKKIRRGSAKQDLFKQIDDKLKRAPLDFGEPLRAPLYPGRRLRTGKFRVVYLPREDTRTVHILAVRARADVYDDEDLPDLLRDFAGKKDDDSED